MKRIAAVTACSLLVTTASATIAGKVFCDTNGNGILDPGEAGISGVTVRVCNLSKLTDVNGNYSFNGTELGSAVCVPPPSSSNPYIVSVDPTTAPSDCSEYSCPMQQSVQTTPAFNVNFCFKPPTTPPPPPPTNPGTGTPGFWKNHPEAWPADTIEIGGIVYTKDAAIALMKKPTKGDKTYNMFEQLVSAILNAEIGNDDSCVSGDLVAADDWMADHPVGSGVAAGSDAWTAGGPLHGTLDDYNNGELCAPHRD